MTGERHPLRVAEVACGPGLIGMTACPGEPGASVDAGPRDRDLEAELAALAGWRPDYVVTLMEPHELDLSEAPGLGRAIEAAGFRWLHLPDVDSDALFHRRWIDEGELLKRCLRNGGRILLHGPDRLARTGYVAARLLLEVEVGDPDVAIERIRAASPGAVETKAQESRIQWLWVGLLCQGVRDE